MENGKRDFLKEDEKTGTIVMGTETEVKINRNATNVASKKRKLQILENFKRFGLFHKPFLKSAP